MRVRLRLFASLRDAAGIETAELELPDGITVGEALDRLCALYPSLGRWREHIMLARNRRYVTIADRLADGDEIALFPPVSGG